MSAAPKSRWANDEDPETEAILAQRKSEKEAKRRAKAERQRKVEEDHLTQQQQQQQPSPLNKKSEPEVQPPAKRRRLSTDSSSAQKEEQLKSSSSNTHLLHFPDREWGPCRTVDNYERLNHIEEGTYGWVSRARDINTGEIIALKKLKMDNSPDGFPVTGLREIQTLLEARHSSIVCLREIVSGTKMSE